VRSHMVLLQANSLICAAYRTFLTWFCGCSSYSRTSHDSPLPQIEVTSGHPSGLQHAEADVHVGSFADRSPKGPCFHLLLSCTIYSSPCFMSHSKHAKDSHPDALRSRLSFCQPTAPSPLEMYLEVLPSPAFCSLQDGGRSCFHPRSFAGINLLFYNRNSSLQTRGSMRRSLHAKIFLIFTLFFLCAACRKVVVPTKIPLVAKQIDCNPLALVRNASPWILMALPLIISADFFFRLFRSRKTIVPACTSRLSLVKDLQLFHCLDVFCSALAASICCVLSAVS
jgi:hypothetical protein